MPRNGSDTRRSRRRRQARLSPGSAAAASSLVVPLYRSPASGRAVHWGDGRVRCWPDSVRVTLPYNDTLSLTTTLGSLYTYQFRGNSVYDPDFTGSGSQPAGFDQWAAMYNSYVVLSSRIRARTICGAGTAVQYAVVPSYNSGVLSSADDASATRHSVSAMLNGVGGANNTTLEKSMPTSTMFGVRDQAIVDDDLYSATNATSPAAAQTWYWTLYAQATAVVTLADAMKVTIEYDVKFFDPIAPNQS